MVLLLALFNLSYRIGRESVGQWDESLYATSAWEMNKGPYSVATTRDGQLDYYNSKPPLNAWLIATSFRALGTNLVALRVPSVVAAWLTVVLLQWWVGRMFGTVQAEIGRAHV